MHIHTDAVVIRGDACSRRGKSSGKSSMGMGMSSSSGGSPDARSAPVQHAYLLCTPAAPFFNNPMYCNGDVTGGFKYAVDANGDMIPTYLTRSNLGTRATVNIDRIPRGMPPILACPASTLHYPFTRL
jgi:hypothetical protein